MLARESELEFLRYLKWRRLDPDELRPEDAVAVMIEFYKLMPARSVDQSDGDMLLYQWGTYDFDGTGKTFQFDMTRQFVPEDYQRDDGSDEDEDDYEEPMSQLSLTLHYAPSESLLRLGKGHRWSGEFGGIGEFERFVRDTEAYKRMVGQKPSRVELTWGYI